MPTPELHWKGMTLRDQLREWRERALEAEAERDRLRAELEGLRALADKLYPPHDGHELLAGHNDGMEGAQ